MKRFTTLMASLAVDFASAAVAGLVAVLAVTVAGTALAAPPATVAGAAQRPQRMLNIDINHDGVIDRAEAAQYPRLAEKFDTLDTNQDGRLDTSERPSRQGKRGQRGHDGSMKGLIAADTDGDGRISRSEAATLPKIAEKFTEIDRNRDGHVVRSELRSYYERLRPQREAERAKRFDERFADADLNRDGKLSRIEVGEKMPRLAKSFAFTDEDRDGFLTREDLRRKPRH